MKIIAVAFFLICLLGCSKTYTFEDVYEDKFMYLKADSSLFTGTIEDGDNSSIVRLNYCSGIPCGSWEENETNGGVVSKGEVLDLSNLSKKTKRLIGTGTMILDHWQEGDFKGEEPPRFLSLRIVKNDLFFAENDSTAMKKYVNSFVPNVLEDTKGIKYDELNIILANSVWNAKHYFELTYDK